MNTVKFNRFASTTMLAILLALLAAPLSSSFAAGGGGGGFNSPSQSAPKFDPVQKYQEGIQALNSGDNKKAERAFKKVLSVTQKDANTNYLLGLSLIRQDKHKKARRPLEKAIKFESNFALARGSLGFVYMTINKPAKAQQQRTALLDMQTSCGDCKDNEKIAAALKLIDSADQPSARTDFNTDISQGDNAYLSAVTKINRGDYIAALESLSESARVFGPHPDILTYQGFANRKLGNKALAFEYYQTALTIDPEHRGANEYLGEYYVEIGQLDKAKQQLDKLERICNFGCEEAEELRAWIVRAS